MRANLIAGLVCFGMFSPCCVQSAPDVHAKQDSSAYAQDGRGIIVRSGTGLCWRTDYWTEADGLLGCDGELAPPVAKPIAPPIAAEPVVEIPTPQVAAVPQPCDFTFTLGAEESFGFNQASLTAAARQDIAKQVIDRLAGCRVVESVTVTGHTDRLGTPAYNRKLSETRAQTVAAYLADHGISAAIKTVGAGQSQPVTACSDRLKRNRLIACLAPNRRVVIAVQGLAP